MSRFAQIKRARRKITRRLTSRLAYLGDGNGAIRAQVGKVWIRFPNGVDENGDVLFGEPIPVNPGIGYPEYDGSPVRVKFDDNDEMYIDRADEKELRAAGMDLRMINPGNPQNNYRLLRHAVRLMCRAVGTAASTSALVSVRSWIYQDAYGDLFRYVGTPTQSDKQNIITGLTPSADKHRVVIVFLRMIDQTLQVYGSTEQDQDTALDITDYQECFTQSYIDEDVPIQAFKLEDAQTIVDNRDLGLDLRMFLQGQPRFGEENPITHNRILRSGQTQFVTGFNVTGEVLILGELYDLESDDKVTASSSTFGDNQAGNYSIFEDDGTLRMEGGATVWDDLQIDTSNVRLPAANAPTWTAYKGGQILAFSNSQDNILHFTAQLRHGYHEGQDIEFHIHLAYPDSNAGNSIWNFTYSWANMGEAFPTETTVAGVSIASPTDQDNHQYAQIANSITGNEKQISSVLICSLEREGTHASDTYASDIYFVSADLHFPLDTIGSRIDIAGESLGEHPIK